MAPEEEATRHLAMQTALLPTPAMSSRLQLVSIAVTSSLEEEVGLHPSRVLWTMRPGRKATRRMLF
jgi:hypothetical protein